MIFNLSHSFFLLFDYLLYEKIEDTKGIIRICKLKKKDNTMAKTKRTNNDLRRKLQIEQNEPTRNWG